MYGDRIDDCEVTFRKFFGKTSTTIHRQSVSVVHGGRNSVVIIFPKAQPIVKSLLAKTINIRENSTGRDIVELWKEGPRSTWEPKPKELEIERLDMALVYDHAERLIGQLYGDEDARRERGRKLSPPDRKVVEFYFEQRCQMGVVDPWHDMDELIDQVVVASENTLVGQGLRLAGYPLSLEEAQSLLPQKSRRGLDNDEEYYI